MNLQLARTLLLDTPNWVDSICECPDVATRRLVLQACAEVILPYWESRFDRDDSMANLVRNMSASLKTPSIENDALLEAAIPQRIRRNWDLSPPPGFFEEHCSDCPADFAGDSIYYAACAFFDSPGTHPSDAKHALTTARECLARLFFERNPDFDGRVDYKRMADDHLRERILETMEC